MSEESLELRAQMISCVACTSNFAVSGVGFHVLEPGAIIHS